MIETEALPYRKEVAKLAAGEFFIVPHALKHFRIRIVKKPKAKAEAFLRELIITAAGRADAPLKVYKSIKHNALTAEIWAAPYVFQIAFTDAKDGTGRMAVITVIDTPNGTRRFDRFEMNRRISLQEHLDTQLIYEETLLDLEDELAELRARPVAPSIAVLNHQLNEARNSGIQEGAARMRQRISEFLGQVAAQFEAVGLDSNSELTKQLNAYVAEYPLEPDEEQDSVN
jgi:hypothetical protein